MSSSDSQEKPKILLVVKDLGQMEYLLTILFHHDYRVHAVASVDEACSRLEVEVPDLVVMDMPATKNGEQELARFIDSRSDLANLKIFDIARRDDEQAEPLRARSHGRIVRASKTGVLVDRIADLTAEARENG